MFVVVVVIDNNYDVAVLLWFYPKNLPLSLVKIGLVIDEMLLLLLLPWLRYLLLLFLL